MSRYELAEDQLNRMQQEILKLKRLYQDKEDQLKLFELHKQRISNPQIPDLINTIEKLEDEVKDLKHKNSELNFEFREAKSKALKIQDMEILLEEERKLREYAELFAQKVEMKLQEESMLKELTLELCDLRREEVEITNKRLLETQKKMKKLSKDTDTRYSVDYNENVQPNNSRNYSMSDPKLRAIILHLQGQIVDLYNDIQEKPKKTDADERHRRELENWLQQIKKLLAEARDIENLKVELDYLKQEIESRKKSFS